MNEELTYWIALAETGHLWKKRKNELLVECYEKNKSIADFFSADTQEWIEEYHVKEDEVQYLLSAKAELPNYSFLAERLLNQGYSLIPVTSADYPKIMKKNLKYNSPVLLYVKGNKELLNQKSIAIVGSRKADDVSLKFTDIIAQRASREDEVVVSGYAKGIDRQALESAITSGGRSIVVLPQGIGTFVTGFKNLYRNIVNGQVTVMSTFHPSAPWSRELAMARNPIIYAMAEKIYVAQSDSKGGTYSGVQDGLRKGRTIFVRKPGEEEKNANNLLIGMGAVPVDMDGNVLEREKENECTGCMEDKIAEQLKKGTFSAKELAKEVLGTDDAKSQTAIRKAIKNIKGIGTIKKRGVKCYFISQEEPNLFN